MALSQPPTCADSCVLTAIENSACLTLVNLACLCKDQTYLAAVHTCTKDLCSDSDYQLWIEYGKQQCESVGVFFTTTTTSNGPTTATTLGATTPTVVYSTSIVLISTTITNSNGVVFSTVVAVPSSPADAANPTAVTSSQSSSGGLSTGAKVGIAIGAVGVALIATLIALLLWRRNRKRSKAVLPVASTNVYELDAKKLPYGEREVTTPLATNVLPYKEPITNVFTSSELSAEQAVYAEQYKHSVNVPELSEDPSRVTSPWNSGDARYAHKLSPSSVHTELAAVVPSEIPGSPFSGSNYVQRHPTGVVEADSRDHSYDVSPNAAELDYQSLLAQELSPSPATRPSIPYGSSYPPSSGASAVASVPTGMASSETKLTDAGQDDVELDRMKTEIEALRMEKERIQHLQAIDARERQLSRMIVQKELSRGSGGPP